MTITRQRLEFWKAGVVTKASNVAIASALLSWYFNREESFASDRLFSSQTEHLDLEKSPSRSPSITKVPITAHGIRESILIALHRSFSPKAEKYELEHVSSLFEIHIRSPPTLHSG
jgi:hypothetical protein